MAQWAVQCQVLILSIVNALKIWICSISQTNQQDYNKTNNNVRFEMVLVKEASQ